MTHPLPPPSSSTSSSGSSRNHSTHSNSSSVSESNQSAVTPQFVHVLQKYKSPANFGGHLYNENNKDKHVLQHQPSIPELISHLKLLQSFSVLKKSICKQATSTLSANLIWKCFLSNSIRRFISFISALKSKFHQKSHSSVEIESTLYISQIPDCDTFNQFMKDLLPPLDILLVWYNFLLDSRSAYDCFARNDFLEFFFFPFPLQQINSSIDDDKFSYNPNQLYKNNFHRLMLDFNCNLTFDIHERFNHNDIQVPIKCPNCNHILQENIPLTDYINDHFILELNDSSNCSCGFPNVLTHESLRIRQLFTDLNKSKLMPNIYKQKSNQLNKPTNLYLIDYDSYFKQLTFDSHLSDLKTIINILSKSYNHASLKSSKILNEYLQFDIMNFTILTKSNLIEVSKNLINLSIQQEQFSDKINSLNIINSTHIEESLIHAKNRYENYWILLQKNEISLIPTLDIDFIWHTHRLSFYYYYNWSKLHKDTLINHTHHFNKLITNQLFQDSSILYRETFHSDYTSCFCKNCEIVRDKTNSIMIDKLINSNLNQSLSLIFTKNVNFSHISRTNKIHSSNEYENINSKIDHKYNKSIPKRRNHIASGQVWGSVNVHNVGAIGGGFY